MHDGKVWITDWNGNRHEMAPEELLERIRKDSRSNWNWLAPATEIVKTISDPEFPEPIANELKKIVLRCFANVLLSNRIGTERPTDQIAVAYCYYSLHGKASKRIKRLYRENLIEAVMRDVDRRTWHIHGEQYREFCGDYKKEAIHRFTGRDFGTDFMRFRTNIEADFEKALKQAEESGAFKEDEAQHEESMKYWAKKITEATCQG